jgi:multiple sugar transport system permease protein
MARLADLAVALAAATALFPLAVILIASLMPPGLPQFPSARPSAAGYMEALRLGFAQSLLNSAIVTLLAVAITIALSLPTGYALARLGFSKQVLMASVALVALARALPPSSLLVAIYEVFWRLGLLNTLVGLALAYQVYTLPLGLWLVTAFAFDYSEEVERAAAVDGAGHLKRFAYVGLPMMAPGVAATAVLAGIDVWGEYFYASILLNSPDVLTSSVMLGNLVTSEFRSEWDVLAAASLLSTLPPLLFVGVAARAMTKLAVSRW